MVPSVAIVILNWNGWKDTIACLESVLRLDHDRFGVLLCDNASSDASVPQLRAWAAARLPALARERQERGRRPFSFREFTSDRQCLPGPDWPPGAGSLGSITLINTGGNLGFAGGNNVGLRYALQDGYDLFWLLNNDTEPRPDALSTLAARMAEDPAIGICGSTLVYAKDPEMVQALGGGRFSRYKGKGRPLGFGRRLGEPIDRAAIEAAMTFVSGASMLVSRAFLEQVGLMAEDYFLYFEEPDWAERGRGRFKLGYAPSSIVRHKVGASIGTDDFGGSSRLSAYYLNRNRVRFCWRFHKKALPFVYADFSREILRTVLRRNWSRAGTLVRAAFQLPFRP